MPGLTTDPAGQVTTQDHADPYHNVSGSGQRDAAGQVHMSCKGPRLYMSRRTAAWRVPVLQRIAEPVQIRLA